jgi:ankyrin repeat protein
MYGVTEWIVSPYVLMLWYIVKPPLQGSLILRPIGSLIRIPVTANNPKTALQVAARNRNGEWSCWAADQGRKEVAELLISKNADINAETTQGSTPLHLAAQHGHKDVVELLISKGANVNAVNEAGMRPLMFARSSGNKDVVEILIKNGAQ